MCLLLLLLSLLIIGVTGSLAHYHVQVRQSARGVALPALFGLGSSGRWAAASCVASVLIRASLPVISRTLQTFKWSYQVLVTRAVWVETGLVDALFVAPTMIILSSRHWLEFLSRVSRVSGGSCILYSFSRDCLCMADGPCCGLSLWGGWFALPIYCCLIPRHRIS